MKLTTNFSLDEFKSKDGSEFPEEVIENIKKLAVNLQVIRDELKKPITINSGYRSPKHNKNIGGAKNSYHLTGLAVDISVKDMTPKEVGKVIEELMDHGKITKGGLKVYSGWVHYDIRGVKVKFK